MSEAQAIHIAVLMCCGCLRYPEEVEGWFEMSDTERQRVLKELPHRNRKQWTLMNPDKEFPETAPE